MPSRKLVSIGQPDKFRPTRRSFDGCRWATGVDDEKENERPERQLRVILSELSGSTTDRET
jgi:hypothetical protein